ncbi:beta-defensin 113 [Sus scrofa]|uniref:Beta-defensin n=1 Tax=Sus scrofa TaxID=9823 RepID=A0A4X1UVW6_PIG|nr:beta-defensin 113 [Sus scrofa]
MKIFCIFLTFVFTVSCGPAVLQRKTREKTREIEERKSQCYLVRGACKTSCNTWEYVFNYCDSEPCCVVREYVIPGSQSTTTKAYEDVNYSFITLPATTHANYNSSILLPNNTDVN